MMCRLALITALEFLVAMAPAISQTTDSIAVRQGLSIQGQSGKTGFPNADVAFPHAALDARARLLDRRATVLALADNVPISAKSHVSVRYGATLIESRLGPLSVGQTALLPYADTVVVGADSLTFAVQADGFALQFAEEVRTPFAVVIRTRSGVRSFAAGLESETLTRVLRSNLLGQSQLDPILTEVQASTMVVGPLESDATLPPFTFIIPGPFTAQDPVEAVHIVFSKVENAPILLNYAGFIREGSAGRLIEIQGPAGAAANPGILEITTETGTRTKVFPAASGLFVFPRPETAVFSITFRRQETLSYTGAGRWLSGNQTIDRDSLVSLDFINPAADINDLDVWRRSVKRSRIQSAYTELYAPHTRAWWSGAGGKMTRFRNEYFTNNVGFHDIDVVRQNKQQCLVGVYVGESLVEARQVRLFERSASILSERLSIALGRCVIVHVVAPGKTIQSYDDIERLRQDIDPDFLAFEFSPSVFMYMTPIFQRHFFGYAEGKSPVGTFRKEANGELTFLPPFGRWLEARVAPNSILPSGVYIGAAYLLKPDDEPPEVAAAWAMLDSLVRQYKTEMPKTLIVVEALYERARCAAQEGCGLRAIAAGAKGEVQGGPAMFESRMHDFCRSTAITCSISREGDPAATSAPLIFENDFHFTRFGNDWLAERLARDVAGPLKASGRAIPETKSVR